MWTFRLPNASVRDRCFTSYFSLEHFGGLECCAGHPIKNALLTQFFFRIPQSDCFRRGQSCGPDLHRPRWAIFDRDDRVSTYLSRRFRCSMLPTGGRTPKRKEMSMFTRRSSIHKKRVDNPFFDTER